MELTITCEGQTPILLHSARTVNPLDPITKELKKVTGKRKKTDEDHEAMARIEFEAALYHDDVLGPYIPAENVERCLRDAGVFTKNGKNVTRAVIVMDDKIPLIYPGADGRKGPREVEELWQGKFYDQRPVKVGTARLIRTRPRFADWSIEFTVQLDESVLDADVFEAIVEKAGSAIGLGDFRPRFGRFSATIS